MEVKPGNKLTEAGSIPEAWEYRSVVWTDACPNSNWICSSSPPAARHIFAQLRLRS
jgi:hypothetical protein